MRMCWNWQTDKIKVLAFLERMGSSPIIRTTSRKLLLLFVRGEIDEEVSEDAGREFQAVLCSDVRAYVIFKSR